MRTHLDLETRSTVNLKTVGAHIYATHPTTDILCMAYRFNDGEVFVWKYGEPFPSQLKFEIEKGATIVAHNATFEHLLINYCGAVKYGWPKIPITQFDCTMIRGYAMGLPGSLDQVSKALGLRVQKDMKGHRIMMKLCKPRSVCKETGKVEWWTDPDLYRQLYLYCVNDVLTECELDKQVLPLSQTEKELWYLDQKINFRGVHCDIKTAKKAIELVVLEQKRLNIKIKKLTKGAVSTYGASVALAKWITSKGVPCKSVDKSSVLEMMELPQLPIVIKRALLIRQEAAKNSTAKLKRMIEGAGPDNRIRGCFQFNGAPSTRRWAGRRVQLHNMVRPKIKQHEIENVMQLIGSNNTNETIIKTINFFHGDLIPRISDCLRAMMCAAPGYRLISVDFSQVESRKLAWLAGEEKKLVVFRGHGMLYEYAASDIFHIQMIDVDDVQRLVGKVSELSMGFQGGVGAFQSMAKNYNVKVSDKEAEKIKSAWRIANPNIVKYWHDLQDAAIAAVKNQGQKFTIGPEGRKVSYIREGNFLGCYLPSGGVIWYPFPRIEPVLMINDKETKRFRKFNPTTDSRREAIVLEGITYLSEEKGKIIRKAAYGGLLCENITQSTSRDLLAQALPRLEERGYPIVMHIHDEVVLEVKSNSGSLAEVKDLLCTLPVWASGLPLSSEGWVGQRFRK